VGTPLRLDTRNQEAEALIEEAVRRENEKLP
jgi:hypothetical protein